jgi:hypothetical protein
VWSGVGRRMTSREARAAAASASAALLAAQSADTAAVT